MDRANIRTAWSLVAFGGAIGLLTALSTAIGTTVTLIGLLFTLIGGTILSWFDETKVPPHTRVLVMNYAGVISVGIVMGLFLGMGVRFLDQYVSQPAIVARQAHVAKSALSGIAGMGSADTPDVASQFAVVVNQFNEIMKRMSKRENSVVDLHVFDGATIEKLAADVAREANASNRSTDNGKQLVQLEQALRSIAVANKSIAEIRKNETTYSALLTDETRALFDSFLSTIAYVGEQE